MKRTVTLNGNIQTLVGREVKVGQKAPEFMATDLQMKPYQYAGKKGKVTVISSVTSLDTAVCDMETRRFNEAAASMGDGIEILTISKDLPFAQRRWCGAARIDKVQVVSDYRDSSFGKSYGVLIKESDLLARCVFVIDTNNVVRYIQLVPEISQEPDYEAVLKAVKELL